MDLLNLFLFIFRKMARLLGNHAEYFTSDSDESGDGDHATKFDSELIAMQRSV